MYSYQASKGRVGAYCYFDDAVRLIQARIGWLGVVIGEVRGFQRSPLCSRKESLMSDRPDNELHVEARRLRWEKLEQMPSRGRAIGPRMDGRGTGRPISSS